MPRIPLIWDITASNFPETLTPKNNMTLSSSSPLGHRGKANMTLNSTASHNKIKDSVFQQMPNTAAICRAPEGLRRRERFEQISPPLLFLHETVPEYSHLPPPYGESMLPGKWASCAARWSYQVFRWDNSSSKNAPLLNLTRGRWPLFPVWFYFDCDFWSICYIPQLELITSFTDDCWQFPYLSQAPGLAGLMSLLSVPVSFWSLLVISVRCHREQSRDGHHLRVPFNVRELLQNTVTTAQKGFFTDCLLWKLLPRCAFHLNTEAASIDVSVTNNVYNF